MAYRLGRDGGPAGHFLVHHVDVTVGDQAVRAIEVIGEPDGRGGHLAWSFDGDGNAELMRLAIGKDGVFRFTGGGDVAPSARVRAALTVAEDRRSMAALWERFEEGGGWRPWMDIRFPRD